MTLIPSIIKKQSQDGSIDDGVVTILFWARSQTLSEEAALFFGRFSWAVEELSEKEKTFCTVLQLLRRRGRQTL